MGKSKQPKRHSSGRKIQPTGLPSVKETEAQMELEQCNTVRVTGTVSSLIEKVGTSILMVSVAPTVDSTIVGG